MNIVEILPYIILGCLCLGFFALTKNFKNRQNIVFFLICFGLSMWIWGIYLLERTRSFYWPDKITLSGGLLACAGVYIFSTIFPNDFGFLFKTKNFKKSYFFRLAPLFTLFFLLPFNLFIKGIKNAGGSFIPENGILFPLLVFAELGYIAAAAANFYRQFKASVGIRRQQILYLFIGFGAFLAAGAVFDLLLPELNYSALKFLGPVSVIIFLAFTAFAIIKQDLNDFELFLRQSLIRLLSFAALALLIIVFQKIEPNFFKADTNSIFLIIFYSSAAYLVIYLFLRQLLSKPLFSKRAKEQSLLNEFSIELYEKTDLKEIVLLSLRYLKGYLALKWIYFFDSSAKEIIFNPADISSLPESISADYLDNPEFGSLVRKLSRPKFFYPENSELFSKSGRAPLCVLPVYEAEERFGYFLLGPQNNFLGLSAEKLSVVYRIWSQIQIAFSRAALYRGLEQKVSEQVSEITAANRLLKEETDKRMHFLQSASHQLRTPLTAMLSSLQLLVDSLKGRGEQKELAEIAFHKSKNLNSIVKGMLTLAKIEKSSQSDFENCVSLQKIFEAVLPIIEPEVKSKGIEIVSANFPANEIIGNQLYLEQAFFNILENAVNYSQDGTIRVEFIEEPQYIIAAIADQGSGIDQEFADQIFKEHVRSPNSQGNGLGLYIVRAIIRAHPQAHIWFETGQSGTTFYVRLLKKI